MCTWKPGRGFGPTAIAISVLLPVYCCTVWPTPLCELTNAIEMSLI